ncbi:MAG: hypothetical protein MJZ79_00185 [Paludibacteraceae bacterium]|nr:hypothetical protein [Paludibacteraceae bacterium]
MKELSHFLPQKLAYIGKKQYLCTVKVLTKVLSLYKFLHIDGRWQSQSKSVKYQNYTTAKLFGNFHQYLRKELREEKVEDVLIQSDKAILSIIAFTLFLGQKK